MGPQSFLQKEKGSYILILEMANTETLAIGKLGEFCFPQGFYAYVGSAMGSGGIAGRVQHHLKLSNNPHWHIDYLNRVARIIEAWSRTTQINCEHEWARAISRSKTARIPAAGFGSTDCRCSTHLYYFNRKPSFTVFQTIFNQKNRPEHLISTNKYGKGEEP